MVRVPPQHVVAHRGYPRRYPENTIPGLEAALEAGARFVEFDVQITADGVPVVLHDADLLRTAGVPGRASDMTSAQIALVEVNEGRRLGGAFTGVRVPRLAQVVELLESWPRVTAFVEIKRASLRTAGVEPVVEAVVADLAPIGARAVVISFDRRAIAMARERSGHTIGWIIEHWDEPTRRIAEPLGADYLFADREILPGGRARLETGPGRLAVYTVDDPAEAAALIGRGADLIETDAIGEMLEAAEARGGR